MIPKQRTRKDLIFEVSFRAMHAQRLLLACELKAEFNNVDGTLNQAKALCWEYSTDKNHGGTIQDLAYALEDIANSHGIWESRNALAQWVSVRDYLVQNTIENGDLFGRIV